MAPISEVLKKELKDLYDLFQAPKTQNAVNRYCTTQHIKWTHTPARSPHFGGLWEAAVKSMKFLLAKVVGSHNLFIDELYSITVKIEAILNSRPLTPLDSARDDGIEVLTPGHVGKALKSVPAPDLSTRKYSNLSRWNIPQRIMSDFWEWWSSDYLTHLNSFKKCHNPQRSVAVGGWRAIHKPVPLLEEATFPPGGCLGSNPPQNQAGCSTT